MIKIILLFQKAVNKILRDGINGIATVLPTKRARIYVSSFSGRYADSPKQIALRLREEHPEAEIIYMVLKECRDLPDCFVRSEKGSWQDAWYRATARIVIDNNYGEHAVWQKEDTDEAARRFLKEGNKVRKKRQYVYSSWHGTPLKRMGIDTPNSNIRNFECPNTRMFFGNRFTAQVMNRLMFQRVPIDMLGTPRNDPLIRSDAAKRALAKKQLGFPPEKRVLLYAPTFRDAQGEGSMPDIEMSGLEQLRQMRFEQLRRALTERFGGDWIIVLRFHYFVDREIEWETILAENRGTVFNGNCHDDMMEYLLASDLLLTDASSCMFDFALTENPCILFFPDMEKYSEERGLYFSFCDLPFPVAQSFDQLIDLIENYDSETYEIKRKQLLQTIGNLEDGLATERVCAEIWDRHFGTNQD